jgi:hypothetical protein
LLLQIEETRRALNVRKHVRRRVLHPFENVPARQRVLKLADELLQVVLHHTVKVDQPPLISLITSTSAGGRAK